MDFKFDFLTVQVVLGFILVMTRILAVLMTGPVFSNSEIPTTVRIGFAGALAISINEIVGHDTGLMPTNLWILSLTIFSELLIGASIGFVFSLIFEAIVTIAQVTGIQMGQSSANIFNPITRTTVNPIASFYLIISLLYFLLLGGFYNLMEVLIRSYEIIPLAGLNIDIGSLAFNFVAIFSAIFVAATKFLLPVLAVMLIIDILVALVAKILPQANMYFLIMPNKIILGMIFMSLTLTGFLANLDGYFNETLFEYVEQLFS